MQSQGFFGRYAGADICAFLQEKRGLSRLIFWLRRISGDLGTFPGRILHPLKLFHHSATGMLSLVCLGMPCREILRKGSEPPKAHWSSEEVTAVYPGVISQMCVASMAEHFSYE